MDIFPVGNNYLNLMDPNSYICWHCLLVVFTEYNECKDAYYLDSESVMSTASDITE